jgi:hypothetical protein
MKLRAFLLPLLLAACSSTGSGTQPTSVLPPAGSAAGGGGGATSAPGATSPGGGAAIKACDLLTVAELTTATGVAGIVATETDAIAGQFSCAYVAADGTPVAEDTVITPASPISPTKTYDGFAAGAETLSGIGDRAIWAALPGTDAGSLYTMVGDNLFTLSILTTTPDTPAQRKTVTLDMGKVAASRLP